MKSLLIPEELAGYLKMNLRTVLRKVRKGEIPATKIGRQFRFDKDQIDRWLLRQMVTRPAHILVVGDEPSIGQLFKGSLKNQGYHVAVTTTSFEHLEQVAKRHFDLIFLDLTMSELDGSELFRRIREMDKHVPIAIITGRPDSDFMKKLMGIGLFIVMKKHFDSDDIFECLRRFTKIYTPDKPSIREKPSVR